MNGDECHIDCKYYNDEGYVEGVYHQKCLPFLELMRKYLLNKHYDKRINDDDGFFEN